MFISLKKYVFKYILCFEFVSSNNTTRYEALLASLMLAKVLNIFPFKVYDD